MKSWQSEGRLYCEECDSYVEAKLLHGRYGYYYECPTCGNTVGCHSDTTEPLGSIVGKETRNLRIACHDMFDRLWQNAPQRSKVRHECYKLMADALGIAPEDCHFGHMDKATLMRAYHWLGGKKKS